VFLIHLPEKPVPGESASNHPVKCLLVQNELVDFGIGRIRRLTRGEFDVRYFILARLEV